MYQWMSKTYIMLLFLVTLAPKYFGSNRSYISFTRSPALHLCLFFLPNPQLLTWLDVTWPCRDAPLWLKKKKNPAAAVLFNSHRVTCKMYTRGWGNKCQVWKVLLQLTTLHSVAEHRTVREVAILDNFTQSVLSPSPASQTFKKRSGHSSIFNVYILPVPSISKTEGNFGTKHASWFIHYVCQAIPLKQKLRALKERIKCLQMMGMHQSQPSNCCIISHYSLLHHKKNVTVFGEEF